MTTTNTLKPFMYGIRDLRDGTPHFGELYTGDPDALRLINKALEALTAALEAKQ